LIIDADAVLAESVAPKSLKALPRRYPQVIDRLSRIQEEQLAMSDSLQVSAEPSHPFPSPYLCCVRVRERLDH
jgi:hypothetical protein